MSNGAWSRASLRDVVGSPGPCSRPKCSGGRGASPAAPSDGRSRYRTPSVVSPPTPTRPTRPTHSPHSPHPPHSRGDTPEPRRLTYPHIYSTFFHFSCCISWDGRFLILLTLLLTFAQYEECRLAGGVSIALFSRLLCIYPRLSGCRSRLFPTKANKRSFVCVCSYPSRHNLVAGPSHLLATTFRHPLCPRVLVPLCDVPRLQNARRHSHVS